MNRRRFLRQSAYATVGATVSSILSTSARGLSQASTQSGLSNQASSNPAKGALRVLNSNPRYFTDGTGKAIYLAGSHTWWNFQDNGTRILNAVDQDPPPIFDYNGYLDLMQKWNHNFFRLWRWEAPKWGEDQPRGAIKYCQPHPWVRSGPGSGEGREAQVRPDPL